MCKCHLETVRYLGWIITTKGISMDEDKVETVRNRRHDINLRMNDLIISLRYNSFLAFVIITSG
jgi:hypothetical protein